MKFTELQLNENILKGITDAGFTDVMPVQVETLEHTLQGKDVLVQSQTGSGKTIAFLISILENIIKENNPDNKALIIVPTRELAVQIENEAKLLNKYSKFLMGCFYGGVGYNEQFKLLKDNVDIVIGTPGRLIDLNKSKKLNFRDFNQLIIDEADRLFDMGFYDDINYMLSRMRPVEERKTMLFSATLSDRAKYIATRFMNDPVEITVEAETITVDKIVQELYHVNSDEKFPILLGLLEREKYENVLIFTNTKRAAEEMAFRLNKNDIQAEFIIGDLPQKKRIRILDEMKAGKIKLLIATNVAARGIHIDDLDLVINYDVPNEYEDYVHRIGRTARAGKSGKAITLACEEFVFGLEKIEEYIKMKIPSIGITDEMLAEDKSKHLNFSHHRNAERRAGKATGNRRTGSTREKYGRKEQHGHKEQHGRKEYKKNKEQSGSNYKKTDSTYKNKKHSKSNIQQNKTYTHKHKKTENKKFKKTGDKRLDYYREKYGEDFVVKSEVTAVKKEKKSFLKKITSIFSKKS